MNFKRFNYPWFGEGRRLCFYDKIKKMAIKKKTPEEKKLQERSLIFMDVETTGLDPAKHEIIEIACLVVDPKTLEVKRSYLAKVKPEHLGTADPKALELNQYSPPKWQGAKIIKTVLEEIGQLAPGGMFTGYNVSFDRPFIENAAKKKKVSLKVDYHWLDVMSMVYLKLFSGKKIERLSLTYICEFLGIPHFQAHTALGDAKATLAVYRFLKKINGKSLKG
jgi:DNA polymerase III epsilon subunit-like protein